MVKPEETKDMFTNKAERIKESYGSEFIEIKKYI